MALPKGYFYGRTDALSAIVGKDAIGLSPATVSRLKSIWFEELKTWQARDLRGKRYAYFWVDGIYCNVRMGDRQCLLVIVGATEDGRKEFVALQDGYRESEQFYPPVIGRAWTEVLLDLKSRGLAFPP